MYSEKHHAIVLLNKNMEAQEGPNPMSTSILYCPACGAANDRAETHCHACQSKLDATVAMPLLHERYCLLTQLGVGGFGAVYRAVDTHRPELPIAIKEINLDGLNERQAIEATETFERERRLLANLDHPRVPHLYATFEDAQHWYLVIDYFPGETLEVRLTNSQARQRLASASPDQALRDELLRFGLALCDILHYLHTRLPPLIFRDLKPGNIICCPDGSYALVDFGIARTFKAGLAKDTIQLGSPGYAAPEQYGRAQTDVRAGIYSLGAILHQMLSGHDPSEQPLHFAPLGYTDHMLRHLEALILRMVALKTEDRPASITEVARELRAIREASEQPGERIWVPEPGQTPPWLARPEGDGPVQRQIFQPPSPQPQRKRMSRRLLLGGLGVGTLLVAGGVFSRRSLVTSAPLQPVAQAREMLSLNVTGRVKQLAWSPDDRLLAVVSTVTDTVSPLGESDTLHVWNMRGETIMTVVLSQMVGASPYTMAGPQSLAWSPDNKFLAISLYNGLYIWSRQKDTLVNPQVIALQSYPSYHNSAYYDGVLAFTQALLWSPDSSRIAYSSGLTIDLYNLQTQTYLGAYHEHEPEAYYNSVQVPDTFLMLWSPDGKYIASTNGALSGMHDNPLRIWRAADYTTVATQPSLNGGFFWMQWSPNSQHLAYGNPSHLCAYNLVSGQMRVDADLGPWYKAAPDAPLSAWSADSHLFAFPQPDEHNPWLDIQVREIENGSIRYSCSTRHDLAALTWSPNGNYLAAAYVNQGTNIIQWYNAADGSLLNSATYPAQVEQLLWSPHSAYLVAAASLDDVLTLRVYTMRELFSR